jgi:asparagine synthase (glutamine-hydrolysing)
VVLGGDDLQTVLTEQDRWPAFDDYTHRMMYFDSLLYLPDDILTKVDRASMAVSLEARVPLLDHRVVEYCWRLPLSMKVRAGETKWALRQLIYRYLPREMVDRPKMGFGVPIEHWLRGPLREWAEALLDERRLREEGIFDPEPIRKCWLDYLSGTRSWPYHLWDVLVFQAWFEAQRTTTGSN